MAVPRTKTPNLHSITRRKGIMRLLPEPRLWRVEMTGYGGSVIRDEDGGDPLRASEPLIRLRNIHLAASAPTLKEALILLLQRFESLHDGWHRDDQLACLAWTAIYESSPTTFQEQRVAKHGSQVDMDFEEAA